VDHPCYRCQADIAEGTTFCPHCGAPQIRVTPPESETPQPMMPTPNVPPGSGAYPPVPPSSSWNQADAPYATLPGQVRWELAWKGALLCGVGAAIFSAIPYVSMGCCLWMLGAGALAVSLYRRHVLGTVITPGMGMKIGALTGLFGWLLNALVTAISFVVGRTSGDLRQQMEEQMKKQVAGSPDPKVQQAMQQIVDWISTPQGMATMIVLVLIFMGVVFLLITAAGGALGASMSGRRRDFR
jgi:hypothetical protein